MDLTRTATLGGLIRAAGVRVDADLAKLVITSVEYDSRRVEPGALFVAVAGLQTDGHLYVSEARRRGAAAALVERPTGEPDFPEIVVADSRAALGHVSHVFYGRPSDRLKTHAITGTNGKTTTSYLVDSILTVAGMKTGVIGTLGYRVGDRTTAGDMTSPESLDLARLLAAMVDEGTEAVTMEVSSHALSLKRTAGMTFDTATFTNLSRDHLDFHGSIEDYGAAKMLLFEQIADEGWKEGATSLINVDDAFGHELAALVADFDNVRLITYGWKGGDVSVVSTEFTPDATHVVFGTPSGRVESRMRLVSRFNVMNALAATAVAVSQNISPETIGEGLARLERVPGRIETVDAGQSFGIVVDYAHTPDALAKVIDALRETTAGRVITVFGCGGDRDRGKRPLMGEIASLRSDLVFITSDNPRTEDPQTILDEIASGARSAGGKKAGAQAAEEGGRVAPFRVIEDRREAIERAVEAACPGDVVLIAGKGHENYQIIGTEKRHFDDREEAAAAVGRLKARRR